ncbi:acyl-CoA dehydrogenase family protein [Tardiphaga sp. OK245]|uniref:acyl-CoA dehydrogenase family protein n=1 Tax=Tardiphaga sp. OK245 TaxID=1855306 RepID=UPI0008A7C85A|nr:acyl-CoA dehydrogenase family protein [Tardiphaga sp. OK245]SEH88018.1 Acyl-CoA dehydrogenase [Tardiphaga sp. OK245]
MKSFEHFERSRNWSPEEALVLDQVARIAADAFAVRAAGYDERSAFPWENITDLRELGLAGIYVPEQYSGSPISYRCYLETVRIISAACAATGIIFGTCAAAAKPIIEFGDDEQKRRFLPRFAEGILGALAITEPHAGSDAGNIRTKFKPDGDDIVIDGQKIFITTGDVADVVLLFGKWSEIEDSPKAVSAVLVEKGTPGFETLRLEKKMGTHASSTATLAFSGCRVPRGNLLGAPGDGMKVMLSTLNKSRPSVAAQALGIASAAFDDMIKYANERVQGGRAVAQHQANAFLMADLATELLSVRLLMDHVGRLVDDGVKDISVEASMVKVKASDLAMRMTTEAVQLFGGHGYTREYRVERLMREAKVTQIWEGTNQIQRQVIGRDLITR